VGAVYRTTGTKLGRDVAIKVLPEAFAQDASRMQRFEREAQVLASLNHPNIAAIYGIEQGAIVNGTCLPSRRTASQAISARLPARCDGTHSGCNCAAVLR
jgi:hypothetical protein